MVKWIAAGLAGVGGLAAVVVAVVLTAGSHAPAPARHCPRATGAVTQTTLGGLTLGATRSAEAHRYVSSTTRGSAALVHYCLDPVGVSAGYTSPRLLRSILPAQRSRFKGRLILALTANPHYALHGVKPHVRLTADVRRRLSVTDSCRVGANTWEVLPNGVSNGVLEARGGVIRQVGIANRTLTRSHARDCAFFRSFRSAPQPSATPRPSPLSGTSGPAGSLGSTVCAPPGAAGVGEYLATLPGATCTVVPGVQGGGGDGRISPVTSGLLAAAGAVGRAILSFSAATDPPPPPRQLVTPGHLAQTGAQHQSFIASLFHGAGIGWWLGGFMLVALSGFLAVGLLGIRGAGV